MYSEDRDLVERVLAGEPEAFESIVRKYHRMGGALAYSIVGEFHLAEDVVQEAFLKVFRSLESLRDPDRFRGWFAGLVRTTALDLLRRRRRPAKVLGVRTEDTAWKASETANPEEEVLREEKRQQVRQAIQELAEQDRVVVVLKHMEGLSYKEIAEVTGTSLGAVESRLFRARQSLKKKLAGEA